MKKITTFFILIMLIGFISCDTITRYTISVSVERHPILTIVNQTGLPVFVTAPLSTNINNGARTLFQPTGTSRSIDVTYRVGPSQFTEQVTWNNEDATVTLTRRPPTITVINQTGHQVALTAPVTQTIASGARHQFLPTALNQSIDINYRIGQIQFTEQVTMRNEDVTVTLPRPPTITVINQTGRPVDLTAPLSTNLNNGARTQFLTNVNQNIDITYRIDLMHLTERVNVRNEDVTVTLTRRPPEITIDNRTGGVIVAVQIRVAGTDHWLDQNLLGLSLNPDRTLNTTRASMNLSELSGALEPGGTRRISLGMVDLPPDRYDIIAWGPQLHSTFIRSNVQITRDMTLTFTRP